MTRLTNAALLSALTKASGSIGFFHYLKSYSMKVGLVLSGGGARGISHLGVIKGLEELGVKIEVLAGTSAGSIVGSLYSYGYSPDEIITEVIAMKLIRSMRPAWTWTGLLSLEGI